MSNFNDKIKALLAFSASFEGFKSDVEAKINKLAQPVDLSGLVEKDDLNQSIDTLSEELKKAKFDAFAFDSARRTFGEEIGVLKSFIDKEIAKLNDSVKSSNSSDEIELLTSALSDLDKQIVKIQSTIVKPKSYDAEIKGVHERLEKLPAPKYYDKEIEAIKSSLGGFVGVEKVRQLISEIKKPKDFSADIEALSNKLKAIKLPADKSLEIESLLSRIRKIEAFKPVDYSQEIAVVKKSIPTQIDNSKDIDVLKLSTDKQIKKLTDALSEQSKQMQELKRLLSEKDNSGKAIKSLTESVASINKRVESMSSDNTASTLKSDIAVANKQIVKLQSDFTNFKSAFEE